MAKKKTPNIEGKSFDGADDYMSYINSQTNPSVDDPVEEPVEEIVEIEDDPVDDPIEEPVEEPVDDPIEEPIEEPNDDPVEEEESVKEPVDEPVEEPSDEDVFDDWDDDPAEEPVDEPPVTPQINYQDMATSLDITSEKPITNEEEFKAAVNAKIKAAEEKDFLEGVPTELREAVDIAKQGGDYVGYLSEKEVDYNDFSADEFLAMGFQRYFKNPDGTINDDKLQEYIDNLDPVTKQMQADNIKATLEAKQQARLEGISERAKDRKIKEAARAKETVSKMSSIANLKLSDKHKEEIVNIITSGQLNKVVFGEKNGELDYEQVAAAVFNKLYGDKIISVNSQRVRNGTKRAMLDSMSNKNVKGKSRTKVSPKVEKPDPIASMMGQYGFQG